MRILTIAVLAALALAACGDQAGTANSPGPGSDSRLPSNGLTEDPTLSTPRSKGTMRQITGTVSDGVERGCLLLTAPDGLYLLVGGDRAMLRPGAAVRVTGVVEKDLVTTCQQGTPFRVDSVRPA